MPDPAPWLAVLSEAAPGAVSVVCMPHAGASAAAFHPLARLLPGTRLLAAQLPGRGRRVADSAGSLEELVSGVTSALDSYLDSSVVLYGHSFGALLAFEIARRLQDARGVVPDELVLSSLKAPRSARTTPTRGGMSDDELVADMVRLGADPEPFAVEEIRALALPVLRADLNLLERWSYSPSPPLRCPITAIVGSADPEATADDMAAWQRETVAEFRLVEVTGGHFLLDHSLAVIARQLGEVAAAAARRARAR